MKKNIFSVSLIAMLAVAPFAGAMADVTPTKVLATTSYVQGAYEAANDYTDEKINALDATVSQTAVTGGDGLSLSISEVDGKITSISGSIAANTYDASGAAAAVADDVEDGTIVAGKATADAAGNVITETYATKTALENLAQGTNSAIDNLDAEVSQTTGADGLALNIVEEDGVITSISGSIAANTYASHGAAAAVQ
ncbi:MAG: hypothetical protein MJ158_03400, partial [Alphaproteobacteria bacterium]|nr:hypothetical protein [Alphaproteobacteria bacterium]